MTALEVALPCAAAARPFQDSDSDSSSEAEEVEAVPTEEAVPENRGNCVCVICGKSSLEAFCFLLVFADRIRVTFFCFELLDLSMSAWEPR